MANCEGEIIPCDKNVINTFAHQHLKYDENEKYYIISLENFLFRSKILRTKSNETCFLEQTFYFFYRISVILSFKKKKKAMKCLLFAQYFSRIRNVMQIFRLSGEKLFLLRLRINFAKYLLPL